MGLALFQQVKLDEATEAFNKAVDIKPDYAEAYFNLGLVFISNKLNEAVKAILKQT